MRAFTYRKFASLTPQKQHKECAWILRSLYEEHILGKSDTQEWKVIYSTYCSWMQTPHLPLQNPKEISHAYHYHLEQAGILLHEPHFLPRITRFDRTEAKPSLGFAIYLDDLRSAHNVGSILRTVEAFRLGKVYFSNKTPWITHKKVQDASMGTCEHVECLQAQLTDVPGPLIALETCPQAHSIFTFSFPAGCCIALGNEEFGCSERTLEQADSIVQIPLRGYKNSLNVANAFAICASILMEQAYET